MLRQVTPIASRLVVQAKSTAKRHGLRYVNDATPGLTRKRVGAKSFRYFDARGKPVRDAKTLARIKSLVIPPAWTDVWICPDARGHLQATGRDERGRKQSRYHPDFRAARDEAKYDRVIDFAKALPSLRKRVQRDLKKPGLPREKVLATVVALIEKTLARVGNDEYAKSNKSFGLTTIENRHARVKGSEVVFRFVGKHGVQHELSVRSGPLARVVRKCQELPEQQLFEYVDDSGHRRDVKSDDVNAYLREVTGQDFTAKDFRTWAGTVLAATALRACESCDSESARRKNVVAAIEFVAKRLGNTKAVCRKCYVHPAIVTRYVDGSLAKSIARKAQSGATLRGLKDEERAALRVVQRALRK
jgi:DNA topoisomerase-1